MINLEIHHSVYRRELDFPVSYGVWTTIETAQTGVRFSRDLPKFGHRHYSRTYGLALQFSLV